MGHFLCRCEFSNLAHVEGHTDIVSVHLSVHCHNSEQASVKCSKLTSVMRKNVAVSTRSSVQIFTCVSREEKKIKLRKRQDWSGYLCVHVHMGVYQMH